MSKTKITTAAALDEMRAELSGLEQQVAAADDELQGIAFLAERGDRDAQRRRSELLGVRSTADHRARELRDAIASGEKHLVREQQEAAEAERASWAKRADDLRGAQLDAARKVDAALAALEAAHVDYMKAADERGAAVRRAGGTWSNATITTHLVRAVFQHCARVALHLGLPREQRPNASPMEGLVR